MDSKVVEIFNNLKRPVDFEHWCKRSRWNTIQAITLTLEQNPENFDGNEWLKIKRYTKVGFVQAFKKRIELLNNAIEFHEIDAELQGSIYQDNHKVLIPMNFLAWAKKKDISFSPELESLVKKYNIDTYNVDLEDDYKLLKVEMDKVTVENKKLKESLNGKKLKSLQKFCIGVLALKYGKDKIIALANKSALPQSKQNVQNISYAQIIKDLSLTGIKMDDETIKKYIDESLHHLQSNKQEN